MNMQDKLRWFKEKVAKKAGGEYRRIPPMSWAKYKEIAKSTANIDYKCDFDKSGLCVQRRRDKVKEKMCCCVGCVSNLGYLETICADDVTTYAENFDSHTGFWREGKGCVLPRELRSYTCLTYNCIIRREEDRIHKEIYSIFKTKR